MSKAKYLDYLIVISRIRKHLDAGTSRTISRNDQNKLTNKPMPPLIKIAQAHPNLAVSKRSKTMGAENDER